LKNYFISYVRGTKEKVETENAVPKEWRREREIVIKTHTWSKKKTC